MSATLLARLSRQARQCAAAVRARVVGWLRPVPLALAAGAAADAARSRPELLLENALLRHQLLVLGRAATRPRLTAAERALLVLLASRLRTWADALVIVRPETVLRWHRQGFRLVWRRKSRATTRAPRLPRETSDLIGQMGARTPCGVPTASAGRC